MNRAEQEIINQIDSMSIEDARDAIANGVFGNFDSPNQNLALSRLVIRESSARDEREEDMVSIANKALEISQEANSLASEANSIARSQSAAAWRAARYAMYAAVVAVVALIISNQEVIISSIPMFIQQSPTPNKSLNRTS